MYTIDGVPLSDPLGRWRVHRNSQRRTPVAFRSVDVNVPGMDGNIPIYGEQIEATALALELNVYGRTPAQIEERAQFLRALLGRTTGPLIVGKRGGLTAEAKPVSISDPVMTDRYARLAVTLSIPSGVWRGPEVTYSRIHRRETNEVTISELNGSSRAMTDSLILIEGPANGPRITDVATGSTIRFTGNVPTGENLLIDTRSWRASVGAGVSWGSGGTNATSRIVNSGPQSSTTLFPITPIPAVVGGEIVTSPRLVFHSPDIGTVFRIQARTAHT